MAVKGFDKEKFMGYMESVFDLNGFSRELIENIIDYAHEHEHISKDQFAYFVSDMLPEVEFCEVAGFCEDEILTKNGIAEKEKFWDSFSSEPTRPEDFERD